MTRRCASCGTENPAAFLYCGACGARMPPDTSATAPAGGQPATRLAPSAERRLVTVVFLDLVGFTALSETRDPEEVRDILTRYFDTCGTIVSRHGGRVEKFIGDAVMALWGAPVAHEDDPERAVRAGLELVGAVHALGGSLGIPGLAARAGIVSGEAAVTIDAVDQGMVMGDVVNTASRLQSVARPGSVLVDQATERAVRGSILFEPVGRKSLRGKRSPIPAWEPRQVVALRRGGGRASLPEAPFVGRDDALATAKGLLESVREQRTTRMLSILGPAGLGKSRVVWELEKYVDGVVEPIRWHQARSPAYGERPPFCALAEMVRARAGIADGLSPDEGRARLADCLARFVPDAAERRWLTPHLEALVGLGAPTGGAREEAFAAWRTIFERIAESGTTVLVFDDLHWADAGMLDFIESLHERSRSRPILIVSVARPDLLDRRPRWGSGRADHLAITLEPLSQRHMSDLLAGLVPRLPEEAVHRILGRASGVPLYAVEIVRMLADRRELKAVEGVYQLRGPLGRLDVPDTLRALIASRLDGLDPEVRRLLRDAAVLGQSFRLGALASITGMSVDAIAGPVARMVHRELLDRGAGDPSPRSDRYRFSDELVRDVAYGTLALRDRRSRHLAASRYYAASGEPDSAAVVANHLLAAYGAGPITADQVDLAAETVRALRVAAADAAARHSPEQALESTVEALAITADERERAQLWEDAASFAQAAARLDDAERYAAQALDWLQAHPDRAAAARVTVRLATILVLRYRSEESIALVRTALDGSEGDPRFAEEPSMVALLAGLARASLTAGHIGDAAELADRALRMAERHDLQPVVADALATRGAALVEAGSTAEGTELLRRALATAEENGSLVPALRARNSLAVGLLDDDPKAAFEVADVGLRLAQRIGFRDLAVRLASNWAEAGLDLGRWDVVLEMLGQIDREDLPFVDRVDFGAIVAIIGVWRGQAGADARLARLEALIPTDGDRFVEGTLRSRQSAAALALGRPWLALDYADQAAAALRGLGHRTAVHGGDVPGARAALWAGDLDRLDVGLASIERSGLRGRWVQATTSTLLAGRAALLGEVATAATRYEDAAVTWRRLGVPLQLALCQLEAARLLPRRSSAALAAREEARALLQGLGARRLLYRLAAGLAAVSGRQGPACRSSRPRSSPPG